MTDQLDRIEGKIDKIGDTLAEHGERLGKLETRDEDMGRRVADQEREISEIRKFTYKLSGAAAAVGAGVSYLLKKVGG